eukprot:gene26704-biopygen17191
MTRHEEGVRNRNRVGIEAAHPARSVYATPSNYEACSSCG